MFGSVGIMLLLLLVGGSASDVLISKESEESPRGRGLGDLAHRVLAKKQAPSPVASGTPAKTAKKSPKPKGKSSPFPPPVKLSSSPPPPIKGGKPPPPPAKNVKVPWPPQRPRAPPYPPRLPPSPRPPPLTKDSGPVFNITYDGHVYESYGWWATWDQAEAFCVQRRGGHLLSLLSDKELKAVIMIIAAASYATGYWGIPVWIGLRGTPPSPEAWQAAGHTDGLPMVTSKDEYRWSDGSPLTGYTNWAPGTPYNQQAPMSGRECAALRHETWEWYDSLCNSEQQKNPFVCKIRVGDFHYQPPSPPPPPPPPPAPAPPPPLTDCPAGQRLCGAGTADACCGAMCCGNLCCPVTWRVLAVVVQTIDFQWYDLGTKRQQHVITKMTQDEIDHATSFAQLLPAQLLGLSSGYLTAEVDVEVLRSPLTKLDPNPYSYKAKLSSYWPGGDCLRDQIIALARGRQYDAVVTVVKLYNNDATPPGQLAEIAHYIDDGGGTWAGMTGKYYTGLGAPWPVGYLAIKLTASGVLGDGNYNDVLYHEFGHVMEGYYGYQPGVRFACLHCGGNFGYVDYDMFYHDFYSGLVWSDADKRYIGFNSTVYGFGKPAHPSKPPTWTADTQPWAPPRHPPLSPPSPRPPFPPNYWLRPGAPPMDATAGAAATDAAGRFHYGVYFGHLNWQAAEDYCRTRHNGHLASVHSHEESALVNDLAARTKSMVPSYQAGRLGCVWLGLRCAPDAATGATCLQTGQYGPTWSDGTALDATAWSPYGINAGYLVGGSSATACVCASERLNWRWEGFACSSEVAFVCKWELV